MINSTYPRRVSALVLGLAASGTLMAAGAMARVGTENGNTFWKLTLMSDLVSGQITVTNGANAAESKQLAKKGDYIVLAFKKGNYTFTCTSLAKADKSIPFRLEHSSSSLKYVTLSAEMVNTASDNKPYSGDVGTFKAVSYSTAAQQGGAFITSVPDWSKCLNAADLNVGLLFIKAKDLTVFD